MAPGSASHPLELVSVGYLLLQCVTQLCNSLIAPILGVQRLMRMGCCLCNSFCWWGPVDST